MPNKNESETFILEAVESVIKRKGCILYRCKWKDYDERTDEPWENIGRFQNIYAKATGKKKKRKKRGRKESRPPPKKRKKQQPHIAPRIGPEYQAVIPPYEGPALTNQRPSYGKPPYYRKTARLIHIYL